MAKAIIKKLKMGNETALFAVIESDRVLPGDWVYNADGEVTQCNQSTCIFFNQKVLGKVENVNVSPGEILDVRFYCPKEQCGYPFCGSECIGNTKFYFPEIQSREDANDML